MGTQKRHKHLMVGQLFDSSIEVYTCWCISVPVSLIFTGRLSLYVCTCTVCVLPPHPSFGNNVLFVNKTNQTICDNIGLFAFLVAVFT